MEIKVSEPQKTVYDFVVKDPQGNDVPLSNYKGKVLLITNVASAWGSTKGHYTEYVQLYNKYKDQGFVILAFPCNQFMFQEPKSSTEIVAHICQRFQADFPIFAKVDIKGPNAIPLFKFLKKSTGKKVTWNFGKYLVGKDGVPIEGHNKGTTPLEMEAKIKSLL